MSTAAFFFVITLASTVIASISDSFLRCISCPCGSGNQNYTHCIDESILKDFTCERWSHCQTCKANTTFCITCRPGHFGPTCSETKSQYFRDIQEKLKKETRKHLSASADLCHCVRKFIIQILER
ncbi:hypothetical protein AVEN_55357-1 [Araneus ventricosus]|uniref:TNFR-Cys domain-containing protein n=1 Tax=Araneus ventricosus TaxID=182803 RepID=A0A4Y2DEA0_ARAVE|nr:hypothetical protein AVEN_55357-1 [Araneus ventricosus]